MNIMELEEEQKSVAFQSSKMAVRGRGDCSSKITANGKKNKQTKKLWLALFPNVNMFCDAEVNVKCCILGKLTSPSACQLHSSLQSQAKNVACDFIEDVHLP